MTSPESSSESKSGGAPTLNRRSLISGGALTAAASGAALFLDPLTFAAAAPAAGPTTKTITGHLDTGCADWIYLPVDVPAGVQQIAVSYTYDRPAVPAGVHGNSCDIGIFDNRGIALGSDGFRGWSGGFRTEFAISNDAATPGYLPGRVSKGRWHVILGPYQVAPQGLTYSVTVTLTYGPPGPGFQPHYPRQRVAGTGVGWYRGDCHLHTVHSDGRRTPAEVAAGARAAGLDFIVSTDHNTSSSHGAWGPLAGDDLLIITGEEITSRNGHVLALGIDPGEWVDWRYRSVDGVWGRFVQQVHDAGGLVVPAHPYCAFVGCYWKFGFDEPVDAVEVWNGPWTVDDDTAILLWDGMLVDGVRRGATGFLPAMANSDAHSDPQVIGLPQTIVRAASKSRSAILAGLRAGRSWMAESSAVQVDFTVAGGGQTGHVGDRLAVGRFTPLTASVAVSGVPNGVIRFIGDEGQMQQTQLDASGAGTASMAATASLCAYLRIEVRHPRPDGSAGNGNGMGTDIQLGPLAALTNPIFLGK